MAEATYVGHHKKKIAFVCSQRCGIFAEELRDAGWLGPDYATRLDRSTKQHAGSLTALR
jgi:deoxyribodipyrimidine photolyase-like uncharacterized protein